MRMGRFDELGQAVAQAVQGRYPDYEVVFFSGIDVDGHAWAGVLIAGRARPIPAHPAVKRYELPDVPLLLTVDEGQVEAELQAYVETLLEKEVKRAGLG